MSENITIGSSVNTVNSGQPGRTTGPKMRINAEGKLTDQQTDGATPVNTDTRLYRSINGKISTSSSSGVLTSLTVEAKIQAGIDSLTQELAEAKQQGNSGHFWSKVYTSLLNRSHPLTLPANASDEQIIALAVAADNLPELGKPINQGSNTTPPSSTATSSSTPPNSLNPSATTSGPTLPPIPNKPSTSPTTTTAKNGDTIAALMAQLNGTRISDVTAAPTTSGNNKFDIGFRRRDGSMTLVMKYPSLTRFLNNEQLEALDNFSNILESHKSNPIKAVGEIYGFRSIRVQGANPFGYIKAKLKKTTFLLGLKRKPQKVAKAIGEAIDFYTNLLEKVNSANGFDQATIDFKTQFLNQLTSVQNAYMAQGAERYASQMRDITPPTATTPQGQTIPTGQRAPTS